MAQTELVEIKSKLNYAVTEQLAEVDALSPRARVVRVRVAPREKYSANDRYYPNYSAESHVQKANQDIGLGLPHINYLSHPNDVVDRETGEYAGFRYPKSREFDETAISKTLRYEIEGGEIFAVAEFLPTTVGKEWAKRAMTGEDLKVSWRTISNCTGAGQTGTCLVEDFDGWDWLDDHEIPGFSQAGLVGIVENKRCLECAVKNSCPCKGTQPISQIPSVVSDTEVKVNSEVTRPAASVATAKVVLEALARNNKMAKNLRDTLNVYAKVCTLKEMGVSESTLDVFLNETLKRLNSQ